MDILEKDLAPDRLPHSTHIHTQTHTHRHTNAQTHTYTQTHTHIHRHTHTYTGTHTHTSSNAKKHKYINYFRHVDDILLIFDPKHTDIHTILAYFNSIHPKLHFKAETEQNSALNYLDVTTHEAPTNINISIYRNPTLTLIPHTSNQLMQHEYAAIRFLYNRLNTYQLHNEEYQREENVIHNTLYNIFFRPHPQKPTTLNRDQLQNPPTDNHRWVTSTYVGKETTYITNIFKNSNIRTAYHTNNTLLKKMNFIYCIISYIV